MRGYILLVVLVGAAFAEESGKQFSQEDFNNRNTDTPHFVKFYAPWCGHCKRMAPTWEELAGKFNDAEEQDVVIGKVDCTVETALCSEQGVSGYPTIKFFKADDSEGSKYKGQRDLDSLSKFVLEQIGADVGEAEEEEEEEKEAGGPAVADKGLYVLTNDNFENHIATGSHLIKFYAPWCGHCKRLAPTWDELAQKYEDGKTVKIGKVDCTEHNSVCGKYEVRGYPTLLFFKDGKMAEKYASGRDMSSFEAFIAKKSGAEAPSAGGDAEKQPEKPKEEEKKAEEGLFVLTADTAKGVIDSEKTTFVKFFAPWCGHCKTMAGEWIKLAAKYANSKGVQIAEVDCTQHRETCSEYGVKGFPTIKLFREGKEVTAHRGGRDMASFEKVLKEHALEGQMDGASGDEAPKEEEKPKEPKEAPEPQDGLLILTNDNFDSIAMSTKTSFVMFYAPWCGHCKSLAPTWDELAASYKDNESVVIGKVDCTENKEVCSKYGVRGYPTLKLFSEGKEIAEHNGGRSVEAMQAFVDKNFKPEEEDQKKDEL